MNTYYKQIEDINYTVYFEFCGRKMKANVVSKTPEGARSKVKEQIIFYQTEVMKGDSYKNGVAINDI